MRKPLLFLVVSFFAVWLTAMNAVAQTNGQIAPETSPQQQTEPASTESPTASETGPAQSNNQPSGTETGETPLTNVDALPPSLRASIDNDLQTIRGFDVILRQVSAGLARETLTGPELNELRNQLDDPRNELPGIITRLQDLLGDIEARVDQLGPVPEEGAAPESDAVVAQRQFLEQGQTTISGALSQARVLLVGADQVASRVAERRRDRFTATLAARTQSILDPALWRNAAPLVMPAFQRLSLLFQESARATANRVITARDSASRTALLQFGLLLAALAFSIAMLVWGYRYLRREVTSRASLTEPEDRMTRLTIAVWSLIVQGFLPLIALTIVLITMAWMDVFPRRFETLTGGIAIGAGLFFMVRALGGAILRPRIPALRLVSATNSRAATITRLVVVLGAVIGIDAALNTAFDVVAAEVRLEVARSAVFAILVAVVLFALLRATRTRPTPDQTAEIDVDGGSETVPLTDAVPEPTLSGGMLFWVRLILWLGLAVITITAVGGYIALSAYIAGQMIYAGAVLATLYLLLRLADEISLAVLAPDSHTGNRLARAAGLNRSAMDQLVVIAGGLIRLTLIVVALVLVLMPWGFETREWAAWIRRAFFGFQVGEITISLSAILSALVLFGVGYAITRAVQNWLDNRFLPRTELDVGLKTSIRTGLGYIGIVAAAAFAVSFVGLDLANLAIVAGALSVGIGFGLQSVVNNFVSGLILLAERPIKVGDWIEAGGEQGYVRRINVRSTEVQTFDRASVIIPNSDLISGVVKNMMHTGKLGRIRVNVGVSYDTDIDQVRAIILDCAKNHPQVLSYPEPRVHFLDFGASSLDLALYAFLGDVDNSLSVASDLRYAILSRFREAGIEIPFPQRDLNVRGAVKFDPIGDGTGIADPVGDLVLAAKPETSESASRKTSKRRQSKT
ncbi:MAG: DUF3772 domain-containing protein [Pseudomonadota bacterium]